MLHCVQNGLQPNRLDMNFCFVFLGYEQQLTHKSWVLLSAIELQMGRILLGLIIHIGPVRLWRFQQASHIRIGMQFTREMLDDQRVFGFVRNQYRQCPIERKLGRRLFSSIGRSHANRELFFLRLVCVLQCTRWQN